MNIEKLAMALQGFGAGVAGNLPQFLAQKDQRDLIEQQQKEQKQQQLSTGRKRAMALDMRGVAELLRGGFADRAITKLNNREKVGMLLPDFDPVTTREVRGLIESGNSEEALKFLDIIDRAAVDEGVLPKRDLPTPQSPEGKVRADESAGFLTPEEATTALTPDRKIETDANGRKRYVDTQELVFPELEQLEEGLSDKDLAAQAASLRKEISTETKDFKDIANAWDRISASAQEPSAAGDLALIFNYMKMLDPGSTVREGEFANAQNSAGIPERIRAQYNNVRSGERLTDTTRADFIGQAQNIFNTVKARNDLIVEEYAAIGGRLGIAREDIVINRGADPEVNVGSGLRPISEMSDDELLDF